MAACLVVLLLLTGLSACALWEHHQSYVRYRDDDGVLGFEYHLGMHRLQKEAASRGVDQEELVILLMDEELRKANLCASGYSIVKSLVDDQQDRVVFGACTPAGRR